MAKIQHWMAAARPKTLPAAIAPVLVGSGVAATEGAFVALAAGLCLCFALLMQIGTNFANDYIDFIKGTDDADRIGPARAVASGWISPQQMRLATAVVLAAGFFVGLGLIPFGGWWLVFVGLASIVCAFAYTGGPFPLAYRGLGDVFVVLFFGLVAVGCTYYVQAGNPSPAVWALGLSVGLVINNLLLVNNYRDMEGDARAGKRTVVVRFGRRYGEAQYILSLIVPALLTIWIVFLLGKPLLALALLPLGWGLLQLGRLKRAQSAAEYGRLLAGCSAVVVSYALATTVFLVVI